MAEDAADLKPVIIVGAGIAGLVAARKLAEAGRPVLLLEAGSRVGGRIYSQPVSGLQEPVELGAEFIHGRPEDLLALIAEAGLTVYELSGQQYSWSGFRLEPAVDDDDEFSALAALPLPEDSDLSFQAFLSKQTLRDDARRQLISFVEGFNAASADLISSQALKVQQDAEEAIEGDRAFHVREGYSAVTEYLLDCFLRAGGNLILNRKVNAIRWAPGAVSITVSQASESSLETSHDSGQSSLFHSRQVIVTVPLGVLQQGMPSIEPKPEILNAIGHMVMGKVHRLTLVFEHRFWLDSGRPGSAPDLSFLFTDEEPFKVWWTSHPSSMPVLTAWIGGSRTEQIASRELLETALQRLSIIFARPMEELRSLLQSSHHHHWNADDLTLGAYSYVRTNGLKGSRLLSHSVDDTLFFAGEHTDLSGHWGTVHGALRSGKRAAAQILKTIL